MWTTIKSLKSQAEERLMNSKHKFAKMCAQMCANLRDLFGQAFSSSK